MTIDDLTFPETRRASTRVAILTAIEAEPMRARRRRTSTIIAVAVAAVVIPTGVATAYSAFTTVEDTSTLRCFTEASLDGEATYLTSTDGPDGKPVEFPDPVGACGDLWAQGVLVAGVHDAQPPTPGANLRVPPLAACVIGDHDGVDIVAVIPGDVTVCRELGLTRWAPQ